MYYTPEWHAWPAEKKSIKEYEDYWVTVKDELPYRCNLVTVAFYDPLANAWINSFGRDKSPVEISAWAAYYEPIAYGRKISPDVISNSNIVTKWFKPEERKPENKQEIIFVVRNVYEDTVEYRTELGYYYAAEDEWTNIWGKRWKNEKSCILYWIPKPETPVGG